MRLDTTMSLLNEIDQNIDPFCETKSSFEAAGDLVKSANAASWMRGAGNALSGMWSKGKNLFGRMRANQSIRRDWNKAGPSTPNPAPKPDPSLLRDWAKAGPDPGSMSWKAKSLLGLGTAGAGYGGLKTLTSPYNPSGPIEYGREREKLQNQGGMAGLLGSTLLPFLNPVDATLNNVGFNENNMLNRVRSLGYDVYGNPTANSNGGFSGWFGNWFGSGENAPKPNPFYDIIGIDNSGQPVYDMTEQGRMADSMLSQQLFEQIKQYRDAQMRGYPVNQAVKNIQKLREHLELMPETSRSVDLFNRYFNANPMSGVQPFATSSAQSQPIQAAGPAPEMDIY